MLLENINHKIMAQKKHYPFLNLIKKLINCDIPLHFVLHTTKNAVKGAQMRERAFYMINLASGGCDTALHSLSEVLVVALWNG